VSNVTNYWRYAWEHWNGSWFRVCNWTGNGNHDVGMGMVYFCVPKISWTINTVYRQLTCMTLQLSTFTVLNNYSHVLLSFLRTLTTWHCQHSHPLLLSAGGATVDRHLLPAAPTVYDTIRDASLTCAQNPTWVSLIYSKPTAAFRRPCSAYICTMLGRSTKF